MIREALESNYDLRDAVARVDAARANLGITRADQFPTIAVSSNITTSPYFRGRLVPAASGHSSRQRTFGSVALNLLSFEADIWGRLRSATEAARADLLATEENRKTVVMTLVSDVAGAYFNLLELDMELAIAERTLTTREESLKLIRNRERSGLATLLDVRQGEQLVHAAEQVIPNVEQHIEQTENQISLLLGRNPGPITRGRLLTEQEQPPSVPSGLPSALLERRPDIRAAEQKLISANAMIGVAKAAYYPRISLTGLLGSQSNQLSNLFSSSNGSLAVRTAGRATDLYGWTHPLDRRTGRGAATARAGPVRASDSNGIPRSVGYARSVSKGKGDSRGHRNSWCRHSRTGRGCLIYGTEAEWTRC